MDEDTAFEPDPDGEYHTDMWLEELDRQRDAREDRLFACGGDAATTPSRRLAEVDAELAGLYRLQARTERDASPDRRQIDRRAERIRLLEREKRGLMDDLAGTRR